MGSQLDTLHSYSLYITNRPYCQCLSSGEKFVNNHCTRMRKSHFPHRFLSFIHVFRQVVNVSYQSLQSVDCCCRCYVKIQIDTNKSDPKQLYRHKRDTKQITFNSFLCLFIKCLAHWSVPLGLTWADINSNKTTATTTK